MKKIKINGDEAQRSVNHYFSDQEILLVGEGDFSFSLSLAMIFGSASNIVATSLDSKNELMKKYKNAESNIEKLIEFGAQVIHEVDATRMRLFRDLIMRKFDRIVFNFPHAGFHGREKSPSMIRKHSELVQGFFRNAAAMLRPDGEVHVSHKTKEPYCYWNLEELALGCSLALRESVKFNKKDYPWYNNKRGDGKRSDIPFHLGECRTFKFTFTRYSEFTRTTMNLHKKNGIIPTRRYRLGGDAASPSVSCNNQLPLSAQDRGSIDLRGGIVPEAAAAFSRSMVTPRNLNQQQHMGTEDQRALRSLWLLLISFYGQHPEVACRI